MKRILILSLLALIISVSGCVNQNDKNTSLAADSTANASAHNVEKIEMYHFHGQRQCYSCITLGEYAEETVNTYFTDELKSGRLVFGHINVELPENTELTEKYGATGSSLWIGVYDEKGFHAEEDTNVWYKINNKDGFIEYLKGVIEEKFSGF